VDRKSVRFVTVRAPEPNPGGLNLRKGVLIRTDPAVDLATGQRATKGEALHSGLRESSPPSPDGLTQLVNNYLNWGCALLWKQCLVELEVSYCAI
jgi:hypothetical protein